MNMDPNTWTALIAAITAVAGFFLKHFFPDLIPMPGGPASKPSHDKQPVQVTTATTGNPLADLVLAELLPRLEGKPPAEQHKLTGKLLDVLGADGKPVA